MPSKDRAQSSNLLVVNGTLYLIDAGDGVTRRIVQAGYDFRKIGKIFITHPHSDHTAGLATLLVSEWEYHRPEPIDIYGGGVEALVKGAIDYLTPNAEIRWAEGKKRADGRHLSRPRRRTRRHLSGCQRQGDGSRKHALPLPARHAAYGKYKSYSYRFETPDRVVFFTGDTGPTDAVIELAKGADLYCTEATSPDEWSSSSGEAALGKQRRRRSRRLRPSHARRARDA